MTNSEKITDAAVHVVAAVAAPVIAFLIHAHVLNSETGADVGLIVTAAVGTYHGGKYVGSKRTADGSVQAPEPV